MGGAFGEVHGAKLTGLLRAARALHQDVLILFDTGGVRLQEANAGELAIAEIMRAVIEARRAGVTRRRADRRPRRMLWRRQPDRRHLLAPGRVRAGADQRQRPRGDRDQQGHRGVPTRATARWCGARWAASTATSSAAPIRSSTTRRWRFAQAAIDALKIKRGCDISALAAEQKRLERRLQRFGDARGRRRDLADALGIDDAEPDPRASDRRFPTRGEQTEENADDAR